MENFYADQYIYKVGELAKIAGVNVQTVRRYDEKGILSSKRDPKSGYRYYNASDIGMMINARNYRKHGVSLNKAAELLSSDTNHNLKILYEQKKTQENEIKIQQLKLQMLNEKISAIHKSDYFLSHCNLCYNLIYLLQLSKQPFGRLILLQCLLHLSCPLIF